MKAKQVESRDSVDSEEQDDSDSGEDGEEEEDKKGGGKVGFRDRKVSSEGLKGEVSGFGDK